jgi:hypothetical protein
MFHFFNVFSAGPMYLTFLKAGENPKYDFFAKTFNYMHQNVRMSVTLRHMF